jgi:hypothetical protein
MPKRLAEGKTVKVTPGISRQRESWMRMGVLLGVSLLAPAMASAQNCALCYTQAAGAGSRMIHALRSGILILIIPPVGICIGLTIMAYKKRNQFNDDFEIQP